MALVDLAQEAIIVINSTSQINNFDSVPHKLWHRYNQMLPSPNKIQHKTRH